MQIKADLGNTIYRDQIHIFLGTGRTVTTTTTTAAAAVIITVPSIFKNVPDIMGARLRIS